MDGMVKAMFAGKAYVVRLHTTDVVETNGEVNNDEGYIEWRRPLADMMTDDGPWELTASINAPQAGGFLFIWIIVAVVAVVVIVVVGKVLSRNRNAAA
ncbi:MAG: hypothetical protein CMJ49_06505 [Planctomycetaceae bacterium]|nr:hypothetical protein [Planctomycetaceae bacterium]